MSKKLTFEELAKETAYEGYLAMKAYLAYQGNNSDYLKKAKIGAVAAGSYVKLRGTMANERQIAVIEQKMGQKVLAGEVDE